MPRTRRHGRLLPARRWPVLSLLAPLLLLAPGAAGAVELTLEQAVSTALEQNPALMAVQELTSQVEGGIKEAKADAFPQVAIVGSWGQSRSPSLLNSPDFADIIGQIPGGVFEPATQELYRTVVEVSQTVWSFGKIGAGIDLARIVAEAADAQISTARLDTASAAAEAYFRVLAARHGLSTIEDEREFRRQDLERVESLLEIGEATELERLRAQAALAEVEPELVSRQGQVAVAETGLRRVLALPPGEPLELAEAGATLPEPPPLPPLVERALAERPELDDLALQARAYEKQIEVTRAESLPQIDFSGSWGREVRLPGNLHDPLYDAWTFGIGVRWELFDGGRRKGRVAQSDSQRQQILLQRADLEARVRLEIDQALSDYQTARARSESSEVAAAAAREALRVARENYEQGVATQTDLLDAQSRATAADVLAVEAYYDARIQAVRVTRALGALPTAAWPTSTES